MIPSREVYNRILWDARLDAAAFVIGYQDRMADEGIVETPVPAWDPDGDVPWHRIRYLRCGDTVVWDRDLHIDLFEAEALPASAWVDGAGPAAKPGAPLVDLASREALLAAEPTHRAALVAIPPEELWPEIQAIRRAHDRNATRWMPHITLIYGFVAADLFGPASQVAAAALANLRPFPVRLDGYETFQHRSGCTAWLRPVAEPEGALSRLQGALQAVFPRCDEQARRPSGFVPHLSVGQFRTAADAIERLPAWRPAEFLLDSVALISREGDGPFEVRRHVPLGSR